MSEAKVRTVRLDDENFEWLGKLPGRTLNEAITALRQDSGSNDLLERLSKLPTIEQIRAIVDDAFQISDFDKRREETRERMDRGARATERTGIIGGFPCRCVHSGCRGSKFTGTARFQNICPECSESGHKGEPRNCQSCADDSATGAL